MASATTPATEAHVPPPTGKTTLAAARTNLKYLWSPQTAAAPGSLVTRSSLKSLRYVLKFAFFRLLRYFKYAAIAAGAAALAGTTIGTLLPVAGALLVPSVPVAAAMGLTTAAIKFGWRHRGNHFRQGWASSGEGRDARSDERNDAEEAEAELEAPSKHGRKAEGAWAFS